MSSIPWGTVITAASTLIAGWGGISLKDWHDARRARQERRRAAYLEFMLRLDHLRRVLGAPQTLDEQVLLTATLKRAVGQAVGAVQQAYFAVFLAASPRVQPLAGAAWSAAWKVNDWFDPAPDSPVDLDMLRQRVTDFQDASEAFAVAARAAEDRRLPQAIPDS